MTAQLALLQEIPRTPDYAPSRTFYLFSVNLPYLSRMVLERCFKAMGNLIAKRIAETKENKSVIASVCLSVCVHADEQIKFFTSNGH